MPKVPGLFTGMRITFGELHPHAVPEARDQDAHPGAGEARRRHRPVPARERGAGPRARGVIALKSENCTVCMLCSRSCPDWCIYIEGHKTKAPPRRPGGKERTVSALDRFDIDYALCMYCGICVEVCPFDALFWSPEYEYSETRLADLLHDEARLNEWMETVPDFEAYEAGSEAKVQKVPADGSLAPSWRGGLGGSPEPLLLRHRRGDRVQRLPGGHHRQRRARRPPPRRGARLGRGPVRAAGRRVRRRHPGARLHRRHRRAVPVRHHAHPRQARPRPGPHQQELADGGRHRPAALRRDGLRPHRRVPLGRDADAGRSADHHGERLQHRHRERLDLLHLPRARSRSCPCSCSPPSSAPSSWRGRTDGGRPAAQPVPAARRDPLLPRRLRRDGPQERACSSSCRSS